MSASLSRLTNSNAFLSQMWVWNQTFFQTRFSLSFIHSHEHRFSLSCSIDGCEKKICSHGFLPKTYQEKAQQLLPRTLDQVKDHARNDTILNSLLEVHEVAEYDHDHIGEEDIEIGETEIDFQQNVFLISLREKYKLPFIVIPQIISEFFAMICHHQAYFSHTLNQYLADSHMHINEQECNSLRELFEEKSDLENAFLSLDSEYKLNKFARLKLNYIKPTEYKPNPRNSETYQYVPILETVQNLLSHDDILVML